jgi:hypothetical protein
MSKIIEMILPCGVNIEAYGKLTLGVIMVTGPEI